MYKCIEKHKISTYKDKNTKEINGVNKPISIKGIKLIINNIPKESKAQMAFLVSSTKHLRKKLYQFSIIFPTKYKQMEYFQTYSI